MLKAIGFRSGPEVWFLAGDGICGIAFAWCSVARVTVGVSWPPVWGYHNTRRWVFLKLGVVMLAWRTGARSGYIRTKD